MANILKLKYLFVNLLFIFIYSCNDNSAEKLKEQAAKNNFSIEFGNVGQIFYGDSIVIKIKSNNEENIKEVNIFSDDKLLISKRNNQPIKINSTAIGGGEKQIVALVKFADGKEKTERKNIILPSRKQPLLYTFEVLKKYPHDNTSYTQGLEWLNGSLVESTGNYSQSKLRKTALSDGKVKHEIKLDDQFFGEGITVFKNKIYQLTYKEKKVFVYDATTFEKINELNFASQTNEGWGLTHNDTSLIFSDGSATLYFCDPATFSITKKIKVFDHLKEVTLLNELEYHQGKLFANIYGQPFIAEINPATGEVLGYINLTNLLKPDDIKSKIDVLNGIAVNENTGNFLVTGKWWPYIFELKLTKVDTLKSI
jgi:glutaminyl-peptide cyclotransferase